MRKIRKFVIFVQKFTFFTQLFSLQLQFGGLVNLWSLGFFRILKLQPSWPFWKPIYLLLFNFQSAKYVNSNWSFWKYLLIGIFRITDSISLVTFRINDNSFLFLISQLDLDWLVITNYFVIAQFIAQRLCKFYLKFLKVPINRYFQDQL